MTKQKAIEERINTSRKREKRETYGNGSVSPVMVVKKDKNGKPVIGEDGKPVKVQKRDKQGRLVWLTCVTLGTQTYIDEHGRRRTRQVKATQHRIHGTLKEAREAVEQQAKEYDGIDLDSADMTFAGACSSWAKSMRISNTCSEVKLKDYETMMGHVSAQLGDIPLVKIKKLDIEDALTTIKTNRGLSQRRHREIFQTVKRVFEYCIDNGWLVRNPCRGMNTPRVTKEVNRRSLTPEECARLHACLDRDEANEYERFSAKEHRQHEWDRIRSASKTFSRSELHGISQLSGLIAVRIMLTAGCRRGEALGLTWENVDFKKNQITIRQSLNAQMVLKSPKTKSGIRTLSIDSDTMEHLQRWKEFQAKALHLVMTENEQGEKHPIEQTPKTPVCCNCKGGLYDPTKCSEWWRKYRATIGFDTLKLHELRHTAATIALGSGMPVKDVQARLGHASSALTLDIYGHAIPANDQAIAELMGRVINAPSDPSAEIVHISHKSA